MCLHKCKILEQVGLSRLGTNLEVGKLESQASKMGLKNLPGYNLKPQGGRQSSQLKTEALCYLHIPKLQAWPQWHTCAPAAQSGEPT